MTDFIQQISQQVSNKLFGTDLSATDKGLKHLNKLDILQIGNHVSGVLSDKTINIEAPICVVVGTQSSGKSTVFNRIIDMDILPTGKTMVTRTPMNIQLTKCLDQNVAEFGDYIEGVWKVTKRIELTAGTDYIEQIRHEIEQQTIKKAGNNHNISLNPIILKINSPNVPTLSLIDLPGLTSIACLDKGQSPDIKNQLRQMVGSYIKSERALILLVMASRSDLEVDQAFDLVKEYDPKGQRTIGVLTKPDLMSTGTDITDYLNSRNISESLRLKHGYYVLKNRGPDSAEQALTSKQVTEHESTYFKTHPTYSNKTYINQLGINPLVENLSNILTDHIKQSLPAVLSEINQIETEVTKSLALLGTQIPEKEAELSSMVYMLIANFCRTFTKSLEERGSTLNYGRQIKDILVTYRQNIRLTQYDFTDELISSALTNCDGNHMLSLPSIEVLEYCLKNVNPQSHKSPIQVFIQPSIGVLETINQLLIQLIDDVAQETQIFRFTNFSNVVKKELTGHIYQTFHKVCSERILDLIRVEENYIWTDDTKFQDELQKLYQNLKPGQINYGLIRTLINGYFDTVKRNLMDRVPKEIMYHFVRQIETEVSHTLFDRVHKSLPMVKLLEESPQIADQRKVLVEKKHQLHSIKTLIASYQ